MKAGIIGLGVGEQHISGYRDAGIEVVALCDKDPKKRREAHAKYQNCRIIGNAAEILAVADVNGGLIGGASLKADDFMSIYETAIN